MPGSNKEAAPSLEEFAAFAGALADEARRVILPYWRKPLAVESKLEGHRAVAESPVTEADRNAELAMRRLINARFPAHGIYGEEFGSERVGAEFVWVLDPIDGTKSFITGKPLFGTLVACLQHGVPVVGVIDQCVLDERWVGCRGAPTTLNGVPVATKGCATLDEAMMYSTTPHMFAAGYEATAHAALCAAVKRPLYGADCYAYALVASGFGADLVLEADLGLYDYCALVPVLLGAGGAISDWTGAPLTLQHHDASKGRVLASAHARLHAEALRVLQHTAAAPAASPCQEEGAEGGGGGVGGGGGGSGCAQRQPTAWANRAAAAVAQRVSLPSLLLGVGLGLVISSRTKA